METKWIHEALTRKLFLLKRAKKQSNRSPLDIDTYETTDPFLDNNQDERILDTQIESSNFFLTLKPSPNRYWCKSYALHNFGLEEKDLKSYNKYVFQECRNYVFCSACSCFHRPLNLVNSVENKSDYDLGTIQTVNNVNDQNVENEKGDNLGTIQILNNVDDDNIAPMQRGHEKDAIKIAASLRYLQGMNSDSSDDDSFEFEKKASMEEENAMLKNKILSEPNKRFIDENITYCKNSRKATSKIIDRWINLDMSLVRKKLFEITESFREDILFNIACKKYGGKAGFLKMRYQKELINLEIKESLQESAQSVGISFPSLSCSSSMSLYPQKHTFNIDLVLNRSSTPWFLNSNKLTFQFLTKENKPSSAAFTFDLSFIQQTLTNLENRNMKSKESNLLDALKESVSWYNKQLPSLLLARTPEIISAGIKVSQTLVSLLNQYTFITIENNLYDKMSADILVSGKCLAEQLANLKSYLSTHFSTSRFWNVPAIVFHFAPLLSVEDFLRILQHQRKLTYHRQEKQTVATIPSDNATTDKCKNREEEVIEQDVVNEIGILIPGNNLGKIINEKFDSLSMTDGNILSSYFSYVKNLHNRSYLKGSLNELQSFENSSEDCQDVSIETVSFSKSPSSLENLNNYHLQTLYTNEHLIIDGILTPLPIYFPQHTEKSYSSYSDLHDKTTCEPYEPKTHEDKVIDNSMAPPFIFPITFQKKKGENEVDILSTLQKGKFQSLSNQEGISFKGSYYLTENAALDLYIDLLQGWIEKKICSILQCDIELHVKRDLEQAAAIYSQSASKHKKNKDFVKKIHDLPAKIKQKVQCELNEWYFKLLLSEDHSIQNYLEYTSIAIERRKFLENIEEILQEARGAIQIEYLNLLPSVSETLFSLETSFQIIPSDLKIHESQCHTETGEQYSYNKNKHEKIEEVMTYPALFRVEDITSLFPLVLTFSKDFLLSLTSSSISPSDSTAYFNSLRVQIGIIVKNVVIESVDEIRSKSKIGIARPPRKRPRKGVLENLRPSKREISAISSSGNHQYLGNEPAWTLYDDIRNCLQIEEERFSKYFQGNIGHTSSTCILSLGSAGRNTDDNRKLPTPYQLDASQSKTDKSILCRLVTKAGIFEPNVFYKLPTFTERKYEPTKCKATVQQQNIWTFYTEESARLEFDLLDTELPSPALIIEDLLKEVNRSKNAISGIALYKEDDLLEKVRTKSDLSCLYKYRILLYFKISGLRKQRTEQNDVVQNITVVDYSNKDTLFSSMDLILNEATSWNLLIERIMSYKSSHDVDEYFSETNCNSIFNFKDHCYNFKSKLNVVLSNLEDRNELSLKERKERNIPLDSLTSFGNIDDLYKQKNQHPIFHDNAINIEESSTLQENRDVQNIDAKDLADHFSATNSDNEDNRSTISSDSFDTLSLASNVQMTPGETDFFFNEGGRRAKISSSVFVKKRQPLLTSLLNISAYGYKSKVMTRQSDESIDNIPIKDGHKNLPSFLSKKYKFYRESYENNLESVLSILYHSIKKRVQVFSPFLTYFYLFLSSVKVNAVTPSVAPSFGCPDSITYSLIRGPPRFPFLVQIGLILLEYHDWPLFEEIFELGMKCWALLDEEYSSKLSQDFRDRIKSSWNLDSLIRNNFNIGLPKPNPTLWQQVKGSSQAQKKRKRNETESKKYYYPFTLSKGNGFVDDCLERDHLCIKCHHPIKDRCLCYRNTRENTYSRKDDYDLAYMDLFADRRDLFLHALNRKILSPNGAINIINHENNTVPVSLKRNRYLYKAPENFLSIDSDDDYSQDIGRFRYKCLYEEYKKRHTKEIRVYRKKIKKLYYKQCEDWIIKLWIHFCPLCESKYEAVDNLVEHMEEFCCHGHNVKDILMTPLKVLKSENFSRSHKSNYENTLQIMQKNRRMIELFRCSQKYVQNERNNYEELKTKCEKLKNEYKESFDNLSKFITERRKSYWEEKATKKKKLLQFGVNSLTENQSIVRLRKSDAMQIGDCRSQLRPNLDQEMRLICQRERNMVEIFEQIINTDISGGVNGKNMEQPSMSSRSSKHCLRKKQYTYNFSSFICNKSDLPTFLMQYGNRPFFQKMRNSTMENRILNIPNGVTNNAVPTITSTESSHHHQNTHEISAKGVEQKIKNLEEWKRKYLVDCPIPTRSLLHFINEVATIKLSHMKEVISIPRLASSHQSSTTFKNNLFGSFDESALICVGIMVEELLRAKCEEYL